VVPHYSSPGERGGLACSLGVLVRPAGRCEPGYPGETVLPRHPVRPSSSACILRDLHRVQAVTLDLDGIRYRLRTDLAGSAFDAFAAAGVRPPSPVSSLGPAPPDTKPDEVEDVVPNS
jgi:hypothetical protein